MSQLPIAPAPPAHFETGVFTLSFDFELIWGTIDKPKWRKFRELCLVERYEVIEPLLGLLTEYEIRATWATVGHLFLDSCQHDDALHELITGTDRTRDLRARRDPCTDETLNPAFYGKDLIDAILSCPTPQEIGSHSFTHILFGSKDCSAEIASRELEACQLAARNFGLELKSFVFPRNRVGHIPMLVKHGFQIYRSQDPVWYEQTNGGSRNALDRFGHLYAVLRAEEPPTVMPSWNPAGLWEIPGSMLYTPSYGARQLIPVERRVTRAFKGIDAAVRDRRVFHLWLHPTDLTVRTGPMLDGLRRIFDRVSRLRSDRKLVVQSMGDMAQYLTAELKPAGQKAMG